MTSPFDYPENNLTVTPLDDSHVEVSITIQTDYLLDYIKFFDSVSHFVGLIRNKNRIALNCARYNSAEYDRQAQEVKNKYYSRIAQLFDEYTAEGFDRRTVIKQIGATLRKEKHPWSSPDLVASSLSAAGRPGRSRGKS